MSRLSIIVPIYNAAANLHRCVDSILSQSFADYELLLIDDGSTDGSGAICDEYVAKDSRVRVFHKENGGVSSARNLGLDNAKGEWIYFVDADDEVVVNSIFWIMQETEGVDSVWGGFERVDANGERIYMTENGSPQLVNREEAILALYGLSNIVYGSWGWLWVRLFKREVIERKQLRFDESINYNEDGLFITAYLCAIKGLVNYIDKIIYRYYESETSVMESTKKRFNPALLTSFDSFVQMKRLICNDSSVNQSVKKVSKDGIINRYLMIANNMQKHNIKDKQTLSNFKKICIKECGLAYFITFYIKRFCRKSIRFVCKKLHLNYEIS